MKILLIVGVVSVLILYGHAVNPRSINFNLDTSFLVENNENDNLSLMEKVKGFLGKIQEFLMENLNLNQTDESFLKEFFQKIFSYVLKFQNGELQDLAKITADEIQKIVDENNEFSNRDFKKIIQDKLKTLLSWKAKQIRAKIRKTLDTPSDKLKRFEEKFLEYYDDRDKSKVRRIINRIEKSPDSVRKAKKIIQDSFNVFFYEKYDRLNKSQRSLFVKEVRKLLTHIDLNLRRMIEVDQSSSEDDASRNKIKNSNENNTIVLSKDLEINIDRQRSAEVEK